MRSSNFPIWQGFLDGMCGVYSIVNSYRIVKHASFDESQLLFNDIITHLSKKKKLKEVLLQGMLHKDMNDILRNVVKDRFIEYYKNYKWTDYALEAFWDFSKKFLEEPNRAIILSVGGLAYHYTVVERMTDKSMFLRDSSGMNRLSKYQCRLQGYDKPDKYIIYPNQSIFIGV